MNKLATKTKKKEKVFNTHLKLEYKFYLVLFSK